MRRFRTAFTYLGLLEQGIPIALAFFLNPQIIPQILVSSAIFWLAIGLMVLDARRRTWGD